MRGTIVWPSREVLLSLSVSLIDTATGKVAHTVRVETRVEAPFDGGDAFGTLWDDKDDWIDLGRRMGETALHNGAVNLVRRLHGVLSAPPVVRPPKKTGPR